MAPAAQVLSSDWVWRWSMWGQRAWLTCTASWRTSALRDHTWSRPWWVPAASCRQPHTHRQQHMRKDKCGGACSMTRETAVLKHPVQLPFESTFLSCCCMCSLSASLLDCTPLPPIRSNTYSVTRPLLSTSSQCPVMTTSNEVMAISMNLYSLDSIHN